jgi:hypothetical protein
MEGFFAKYLSREPNHGTLAYFIIRYRGIDIELVCFAIRHERMICQKKILLHAILGCVVQQIHRDMQYVLVVINDG